MESRYLKPIEIESLASSLCSNPRVELLELVSLTPPLEVLELLPLRLEELLPPIPPPKTPLPKPPGSCAKVVCNSTKKNKVATILNMNYN
jgi:hypothetical protein